MESSKGPSPCLRDEEKWVIDIRDRCAETGVLFFFKQWGGKRKSKTGRELDGKTYNEMPG